MAQAVIMPRQGQSVESCLVTAINKKKGDSVNSGDILFSYETDKSSFDEEAKTPGTILALFVNEGDDVPCLDTVMIIGEPGEDISSLTPTESGTKPAPAETPEAPLPTPEPKTAAEPPEDGQMKISPRAKQYAEQAKADLSKAVPTGPEGRIIERDVAELVKKGHRLYSAEEETAPAEKPATPEKAAPEDAGLYTEVKLPNIRKLIAKAMHASLSEMAQLTLNSSFDASVILAFRKSLKDNAQSLGLENITLNDIILYAAAKTLKNHKDANAHYLGDLGVMRYFKAVNLGVAVDTERGLLVPTIFGADSLSLNELAKQSKKIISEAQNGSIHPDKLKNGTFTVTNLGALGVESFTPVINPPQTCILGVNNITRRIKQADGRDIFYDCMGLSLTFDHRALDGAPAAKFLKELCFNLENFDLLLAR
ncbi:MAG: 2-oxo acid dehydrogenase subunit E2 [Oscillospiraceae bacterium]|nr:2-oxo acid dehydrogenase subunit E2 [Oscillospiraceae bacterium]